MSNPRDCEMCYLRAADYWAGRVPICQQCVVDQGVDPHGLASIGGPGLVYQRSSSFHDLHRYSINANEFSDDPVTQMGVDDLPRLFKSQAWEDRVRAAVLMSRITPTMPPGFPCIFETKTSPSKKRHLFAKDTPWVVSADLDLLHATLAPYQELWDAYTSQWGDSSRRLFKVGTLDNISPYSVFAPGATVENVIISTLLTHTGMFSRLNLAPRAKAIYEAWQKIQARV